MKPSLHTLELLEQRLSQACRERTYVFKTGSKSYTMSMPPDPAKVRQWHEVRAEIRRRIADMYSPSYALSSFAPFEHREEHTAFGKVIEHDAILHPHEGKSR